MWHYNKLMNDDYMYVQSKIRLNAYYAHIDIINFKLSMHKILLNFGSAAKAQDTKRNWIVCSKAFVAICRHWLLSETLGTIRCCWHMYWEWGHAQVCSNNDNLYINYSSTCITFELPCAFVWTLLNCEERGASEALVIRFSQKLFNIYIHTCFSCCSCAENTKKNTSEFENALKTLVFNKSTCVITSCHVLFIAHNKQEVFVKHLCHFPNI